MIFVLKIKKNEILPVYEEEYWALFGLKMG